MATLSGIVTDSTGAPLAGATVKVFRVSDEALVATVTSNGSGAYTATTPDAGPFYVLAFKDSPFVTGLTARTLTAV